ncbi:hypothetical protein Patl1_11473 [Pistacia atlantica]|uniref:Uncharacterized protein n=1 Tax=Pistacia atlantica TaxID=434234 RepID=A0ACC1A3Z0_9ROSI|nr:hypothetical protein Patl1_11473 [Pistacia atlantica]
MTFSVEGLKTNILKSDPSLCNHQIKSTCLQHSVATKLYFFFLRSIALVISCMGAAYETAKSGVGVAMMRPELVWSVGAYTITHLSNKKIEKELKAKMPSLDEKHAMEPEEVSHELLLYSRFSSSPGSPAMAY